MLRHRDGIQTSTPHALHPADAGAPHCRGRLAAESCAAATCDALRNGYARRAWFGYGCTSRALALPRSSGPSVSKT
jgi:hypothetical protein